MAVSSDGSEREKPPGLMTKKMIVFAFVSVGVIAMLTTTMLVPKIANPTASPTLLNETVMLTDEDYEVGYPLTLRKNQRIEAKVSGNGQPLDFGIINNQSMTLLQERGDLFYDVFWTAPADGTYTFCVSAYAGDVKATLTVFEAEPTPP
jgi:hypothetical protein